MSFFTMLYLGFLGLVLAGALYLTTTGAALPGPEEDAEISFRGVQQRRSHFFFAAAHGK